LVFKLSLKKLFFELVFPKSLQKYKMKQNILFCIIALLSLFSCSEEQKDILMPNVSGSANEILLILDDTRWEGAMGDTLYEVFGQFMYGLPQEEPIFDIVQISPNTFSKMFETHRNIVRIKINRDVKKPLVEIKENVWASPQLYIIIEASSDSMFYSLFSENKKAITDLILAKERERTVNYYKTYEDMQVVEYLKTKHQISLRIPKGYTVGREADNFSWLSYEVGDAQIGVLVYEYPYIDDNTFTPDYLIAKRDSFVKLYVPGSVEGSYMTTEDTLYPVQFTEFMNKERYTVEMRGLWRMENDFMGGPFVSYTTLDEKNARIVTVEGFVYSPATDKRNFVRQLESVAYTLQFLEK